MRGSCGSLNTPHDLLTVRPHREHQPPYRQTAHRTSTSLASDSTQNINLLTVRPHTDHQTPYGQTADRTSTSLRSDCTQKFNLLTVRPHTDHQPPYGQTAHRTSTSLPSHRTQNIYLYNHTEHMYYGGLKFLPLGFKRLEILQSVHKVK